MNKEAKELIETLKEYGDGFTSVLAPTEESVKALLDYINQLETKINVYENPDDMTLMFMWCDEKAKDKIKQLQHKVNQLETNIEQAITMLKINIEIVKQQPSNNKLEDEFILERYNGLLSLLERGKE